MKYFIQTSMWKNLKKWPKSCHKRLVNLMTRNTKLTNLFINKHKILIEIFINKYEISIFIILINIHIFTYR